MSIASRIQEIETHIGNAYTSIDNLGIDISNTNKNIYNISTLLETLYEKLPKVSGIGASLSLSPSMVGKIKLNEIQGDTLQDGTPTPDTPVEIQSVTGLQNVGKCGKNLLDISTLQYGYIGSNGTIVNTHTAGEMYSSFIKVEPNTTYTFKIFETSTTYNNWFVVGEYSTKDQNSFIIRDTMTTATQDYITFTTTATTQYVRVSARNLENATKVQLEKNNQSTTYEPYKGNNYEVNLGKNLYYMNYNDETTTNFNGVDITSTHTGYSINGTATSNTAFTLVNRYITLPAGTYTVSLKEASSMTIRLSKTNYSVITAISIGQTSSSFTLSEETKVCLTLVLVNGTQYNETNEVMIEKGSTPTTYSPYFTPIELNKIGDYEDYIFKNEPNNPNYDSNLTLNSWYITKNIGEKIVEDNSGWGKSSRSDVNKYYIYNYLDYGLQKKETTVLVCNYLNCISQDQCDAGQLGLANLNGNGLMVQFALSNTDFDTLQKWKTFVGTYKPKVLYVLSTPTYTTITNTELIEQLESLNNAKSKNGTTNIIVTSEDLSMILNVGVLKGE